VVNELQVVMHEGDEPDAFADLLGCGGLISERFAKGCFFVFVTEQFVRRFTAATNLEFG
jgi:hypothetical protein